MIERKYQNHTIKMNLSSCFRCTYHNYDNGETGSILILAETFIDAITIFKTARQKSFFDKDKFIYTLPVWELEQVELLDDIIYRDESGELTHD